MLSCKKLFYDAITLKINNQVVSFIRKSVQVHSLTVSEFAGQFIPVKSGKRVYYFWTMENPDITKSLEDFNFSKFTYRKLAKYLQIKYTKSQN
ncbi:hypothetical protein ACVRW7_09775 [Streptococcus ratti]|uniref:Uncharacterized protein n=1 Tax=Streptococcus ratti FA-1 = DSM 20564 TaxID=699248 RepID=A0ABP2QX12_STRRT|nr:hypothetical protein [Streptococcus ratti]EJN93605.1 hypothetical protein SRA_03686 [Streptococcus ratti FA-1 = DSM 20564]EMP69762.1 hypothetical protein D822_06728 [Streptococcus ratti FA-1 = DSM 20564]QEY07474.1 hypothetical protein FY406_07415 [Streptococcus ratti]VEI59925.1 Uncharacterised protein [Streptococcus mutans]